MKPFNRFTTGVLMAAVGAGDPVGGGGQPPASGGLPPVPNQQPPTAAEQRMQAEIARQRTDLDAIKQRILAPPPPSGPQATQQDLEREFMRNPLQMTAAIAQRVVQEANRNTPNGGFDTQVEMARDMCRKTDPELFDRYQAEIEANVMQVDVPMRVNVTVWKNAFAMVKGNHVNDIIAARTAQPPAGEPPAPGAPALHITGGGGPAPPSKGAPPKPAERLTDEEARVAKKFRITPEEYLRGKKENLAQSDFMTNPNGESSWDKYVTFDSRDKRRHDREARKAAKTNATK